VGTGDGRNRLKPEGFFLNPPEGSGGGT